MAVHDRAKRVFDDFPLHRTLGVKVEEAEGGYARISLKTGPLTMGGVGGSVHGGVLAALVDIVMLQALMTALDDDDQPAGTADLNLTYLRPALTERVIAEARILRKGKTLVTTEVSISDSDGKLCAKGRTIYVLRQRKD